MGGARAFLNHLLAFLAPDDKSFFLHREQFQFPGAVAEVLDGNSQLVEQHQVEVRNRRILRESDMPPALEAASASHYENRQVLEDVQIPVAQRAAVQDRVMVQQ